MRDFYFERILGKLGRMSLSDYGMQLYEYCAGQASSSGLIYFPAANTSSTGEQRSEAMFRLFGCASFEAGTNL